MKIIPFPKQINPELARFFGHIISDGSISCGKLTYCNTQKNLVKNMGYIINTYFGKPTLSKDKRGIYYCVFYSKMLTEEIRTKFSYELVSTWSLINQKHFLAACFDDEGHIDRYGIISITQKDEKYILLIKSILQNLKIGSVQYIIHNKKYNRDYFGLRIPTMYNKTFNKQIHLFHKYKKKKLQLYIKNKFRYDYPLLFYNLFIRPFKKKKAMRKTITITDEQEKWISKNHINLSRLVQDYINKEQGRKPK